MESIDTLNERLRHHFGLDSDTGRSMFRIVWAEDQTEKREVSDVEGMQLLFPIVKEVKKYPYLKGMHVLERLVVVPDVNQNELPTQKLSYEPVWAYCDAHRLPVPPIWTATKFIVDTLYAALGKKSLRKYIEDEKETTQEGREQRICEMQAELFGNETNTADALRYRQGIVVPNSYEGDK